MGVNNIPRLSPDDKRIKRMSANASGLVEYIGWGASGADDGDEVWKIQKLTYAGTFATHVLFAWTDTNTNDSMSFNKEWDERASYTYK